MVFILDSCGIICLCIVYSVLAISNFTFLKIAIESEEGKEKNAAFYVNILIYQCLVFMVVWAHIKTMISEPGYIPVGITEYDPTKLPPKAKVFLELKELN